MRVDKNCFHIEVFGVKSELRKGEQELSPFEYIN